MTALAQHLKLSLDTSGP